MTHSTQDGISRRQLLKYGLFGGVALVAAGGLASLAISRDSSPATGYQQLRESDLPMLRSIIPVILAGALPEQASDAATDAILHGLDNNLNHLSPALLKQSLQLFDLLSLDVTRGPATGIWKRWENASPEAIRAFLQRWQSSRLALFQQGHNALHQVIQLSWYSQPAAWARCGYPGPPHL